MTRTPALVVACLLVAIGHAGPAAAQETSFKELKAFKQELVEAGHRRATGAVEMELYDGTKIYAETVEEFVKERRAIALGNVSLTQGSNHINADRAEFNTETGYGTFFNASGSVSIADRVSRDLFGGQEPDMYFYGEKIERIGPRKYKVTRGGFTTCVQPTPRWQMVTGSVVLNLDHYAFAKNTLLKVKGVPVLYIPALYYPINKEDRATGFLMPVYGSSTITGLTLSNAFFWAISRSQDVTVQHDWFSKSGQAVGAEYRYVRGAGADGNARFRFMDERERSYAYGGGEPLVFPARRSYEITGSATQPLPWRLRARGTVSYFSDIAVQQTYHMNIYDASQRRRGFGGSVAGSWGLYSLDVRATRNEIFFSDTDTWTTGEMPSIRFGRSRQRIGRLPLYWTVGTSFASTLYRNQSGDRVHDAGRNTWDVIPQLTFPFKKWPFLTVDSSLTWRTTYYSESYLNGQQVEQPIWRRYFSMDSRVTGPTVTRVWARPDGGYADGWKHVIEPTFSIGRVTTIDNYDQIVKIGGDDYLLGGTTRIVYGLSNRLLARRSENGQRVPRDVVRVTLQQSYYTDERASQWDNSYMTSFVGRPPSHFSPMQMRVTVSPLPRVAGVLNMEYDTEVGELQTVSASGSASVGEWLRVSGGWSQRRFQSYWDQFRLDNYVNASTSLRTTGNKVGGTYSFNFDLGRKTFLQSRIVGYYNAQCCGIAAEFQTRNYPQISAFFPVPQDRRFNISVTLAGLGTFSNLFGGLGGATR